MKNPTPDNKSRYAKQRELILHHFIYNRCMTRRYAEDKLFIFGLPARIHELRNLGYIILTHRDEHNKAIYEFLAEPTNNIQAVTLNPDEAIHRQKVVEIDLQIRWHKKQVTNLKKQLKHYTLPSDGKSSEVAS